MNENDNEAYLIDNKSRPELTCTRVQIMNMILRIMIQRLIIGRSFMHLKVGILENFDVEKWIYMNEYNIHE